MPRYMQVSGNEGMENLTLDESIISIGEEPSIPLLKRKENIHMYCVALMLLLLI